MKRIVSLFLLIFLVCVFACSNGSKELPEVTFEVKKQLLGPVFVWSDYNIAFCPPKGCQQLKPEVVAKLNSPQIVANEAIAVVPKAVFVKKGRCYVFISAFKKNWPLKQLALKYRSVLKKRYPNLKVAAFRYKEFTFYQFLFRPSQLVVFKLLVQGKGKPFQMDYIIPTAVYRQEIKSVASSIGSLSRVSP